MGATPVVGSMNIILSGDAATFSEALDQAQKRIDQLSGKTRSFGRGATSDFALASQGAAKFGHSSVTSVQAASGALRELNGNFTNNIRAVERFVTMIPGVGNALKFAFPAVGALAFGAVLVEMIGKVREFIKTTNEIPDRIKTGFAEMNQAAQMANETLAVTNDKLAEQIAKLEHKPANTLQTTLDEARLSADQLGESLNKDIAKVKELLEKNKVGFWGKAMGQSGTEDATKFVSDTQAKIDAVTADYAPAFAGATSAQNVKELKDRQMADYQKVYDAAHAEAQRRLAGMKDAQYLHDTKQFGAGADHRAEMNILQGYNTEMSQQESMLGGKYREDQQQGTIKKDTAKNAGNSAALAAQRKAAEAQMKGFEDQLTALKNDHQVASVEEYDFWSGLAASAAKYPQNLRKVREETGRVYQEMGREIEAFARKYDEANRQKAALQKRGDQEATRLNEEMDRAERAAANSVAAYNEANQANVQAMAEMVTAHDVATGAITRHDAAVQAASAHAAVYAARLRALDEERQNDLNDSSMTPEQREASEKGRGVQRVKIEGERDRTAAGDREAISGETALGGATQALEEFIASTRDASGQIKEFVSGALSKINSTLVTELTSRRGRGPQHLWTNLGRDLGTEVAGGALRKGEGMLLSGLGIGGKTPNGTMTNPLWVRMASGITGAATSASGFLGKAGGFLSRLIPGFAEGGNPAPNSIAMVGENGPELVRFGSGGATVVPNHKMGDAMGGMGVTHVHVDARGATDPAQVEAAAHRAVRAYAPHIVAASMQANRDSGRRRPGISGR